MTAFFQLFSPTWGRTRACGKQKGRRERTVLCNKMLLHGKWASRPSPAWPQPLPAWESVDREKKWRVFPLLFPASPPTWVCPAQYPILKPSKAQLSSSHPQTNHLNSEAWICTSGVQHCHRDSLLSPLTSSSFDILWTLGHLLQFILIICVHSCLSTRLCTSLVIFSLFIFYSQGLRQCLLDTITSIFAQYV